MRLALLLEPEVWLVLVLLVLIVVLGPKCLEPGVEPGRSGTGFVSFPLE